MRRKLFHVSYTYDVPFGEAGCVVPGPLALYNLFSCLNFIINGSTLLFLIYFDSVSPSLSTIHYPFSSSLTIIVGH
jgi:hypothetical protein